MLTRAGVVFFAALVFAAGAARSEILKFDATGFDVRASLKIDGKSYDIDVKIEAPPAVTPGAALFLETEPSDDLVRLAKSRGMSVVKLGLVALPAAARAQALRDLVPRLREAAKAKRVLAHGRADNIESLLETGALFAGLLLHRLDPFAAPIDARGPKTIEIFTSDAYWRPGLAAIGSEAAEGANRRRFFIAGAAETRGATANCAAPINARSIAPALRALFVALDEWTKGVKPPASRAPRLHEPGFASANRLAWPRLPRLPQPLTDPRPVPAIDADGNETSGLRLPDHALPIATFTGFNAPKDAKSAPCIAGAAIPFASTKAERDRTNDPRPSLVERYGSRAYFVATMRVIADKLVKERVLLQGDADAYIAAARSAPF